MPSRSRPGILIPAFTRHFLESFTPGSSEEEITETVRKLNPFPPSSLISVTASLAMYQRARKLQDLTTDPTSFSALAEEQLEAYTVAINALSLVDQKNSWVVLPVPPESTHEVCDCTCHLT